MMRAVSPGVVVMVDVVQSPDGAAAAGFAMMPVIGRLQRPVPTGLGWVGYRDVTWLRVSYLTRSESVQRLLPSPFVAGEAPDFEPTVNVYYAQNRACDWLAGGDYNMLGIDVRVTYRGAGEQLPGDYCLVLWENRTEPILTGRELQGIPKVHADITDPLGDGRDTWVRASKNGHPIVALRLMDLVEMDEGHRAAAETAHRDRNWMGWRYIPRIGKPGAALSEFTLFPTWPTFRSAFAATGEVTLHTSSFAENPTQWQFINLLADLEPLAYRSAICWRGTFEADPRPVRVLR